MSNFPQKITSVTKTFSSFIIVSLIAALVVSCASSSSSDGDSAGTGTGGGGDDRVSVFSHSGYTFIPVNKNITLGDAAVTVGRVLVKNAEIRKLVATEINRLIDAGNSEADKVEADDIGDAEKPNYTVKYSFVGADADDPNYDVNSVLNRYFEITPVDPNGGIIKVKSPYSFPVSLEDIFKDVPSVTVKVEVTITNPPNGVEVEKPLSYTVLVNFPGVADEDMPNVNDAILFDIAKVSEKDKTRTPEAMTNQDYTGTLEGTLPVKTALNGSAALSFTSLWTAVNADEQDDPAGGKILKNTFVRGDLLNATETGVIQSITVTLTPESGVAGEFAYTYPASGAPTADAPVDVNILNGNISTDNSLLKEISEAAGNENYTMIDGGVLVLNASIDWSFTYTYQRDFQPNDVTIPGKVELNRTALFGEEQLVTTAISIDGVNNALNRYGFTPKATEQRTIFFTLLDSPGAPANSCDSSDVYLDNQDAQVKAGTSFNYEDLDTEAERQHKCILAASFTGADADYQALIAEINETTPVDSNAVSGVTCTEGFNCYYASLTVNITNVDEAPTIEDRSDLSIAEGKGVENKYLVRDSGGVVTGPVPLSGALSDLTSNDAATGNLANIDIDITIADTDKGADGNVLSVNATETKVTSVSPAHGAGLFSIVKTAGDDNDFTLRVNATELDYEKFVEEDDLNAAGKAIYMVTISTQDLPEDSDDKEGFDKVIVKTMQVPVEITDVRYAPVMTGEGQGFTRNTNIENRSGDTVVVLPGASMLANGLNALGTVKAVNPETDSDKGLFYAVENIVPTAPASNFAVVTGLGDGATPQNLILRGLGLADANAFDLTVVAFSIPTDFNSQDSAGVQAALAGSIGGLGTGVNISISIEVDAAAYIGEVDTNINISRADLLDPTTAPTFTMRQLAGNITEGTAGANVLVDVPAPSPVSPLPLTLFISADSTIDLVNVPENMDITPAFALVTATEFESASSITTEQLKALGINPAHSALFSINSSTGAISLQEENEAEFPAFYNLVVRLANASDIGSISFNQDFAVVSVLVNDVNTAPVISDPTDYPTAVNGLGDFNKSANVLDVTIDENTPVGTVLATFTVTDDNDGVFAEDDFTFGALTGTANSDLIDDFYQDAVKLTFAPVVPAEGSKERVSTATLTLVKSLNFEDFADGLVDGNKVTLPETITISDKGMYTYNPLEGDTKPEPVNPDVGLSASLEFNLIVRDVAEKPLIDTESIISGSVSENATVNTDVGGIAITIANTNATNADSFIYELSNGFEEIFNVAIDKADVNKFVLGLKVADADKLENLGDGQVHTSTLTISNNTGGTGLQDASDPITIQVTVTDVQQPIKPIVLSPGANDLEIKETDVDGGVGDRSAVITNSLFTYKATDVSKDADDFVTIGRKRSSLVDISYAITDVSLVSSTPEDANDIDVADRINSNLLPVFFLKAPNSNGNVSLVVEDTNYIEASLFGNVKAKLTVTVSFIGNTVSPETDESDFTLSVAKADPKNVEYDTISDNAPVYGFSYTQSDYTDVDAEVAADAVGENVTLATDINGENGLDSPAGGRANQINVDGANYNTALVRVPTNSDAEGYFIERVAFADISKIEVPVSDANAHDVDDNGVIVIPFTTINNENVTNIQILSESASGKLEVATNFANYFDIKVNNTYNIGDSGATEGDDSVLLITQKQFAVINSSGDVDATVKYNALDTIPLFKGATEETRRIYYIRASQGDDNASNYALAQFYVDVEASGLNIPAKIEELYVNEVDIALDVDLGAAADINFNVDPEAGSLAGMINENGITQNNFDDYSLFINVSNNDYTENQVGGTTVITVSVPSDGTAPTDVTNPVDGSNKRVSDNQLIALRTAGGSAAPLDANTNNVVIIQDAGVYETHNIDFALARNVYGTATINIKIQENDASGSEIDSNDYEFTLTVNEDAGVNTPPTITPGLSDSVTTVGPSGSIPLGFEFMEDLTLLAGASGNPATKIITIVPGPVTTNDVDRGQEGEAVVASVTHVDVPGVNRNDVPHFVYDRSTSVDSMIYQQHGWGITDIVYTVTETESRGFGAVTATYTTDMTSRITVTQLPDAATLVGEADVTGYNIRDFETSGAFMPGKLPAARPIIITYDDPDLKFADFPESPIADGSVVPRTINAGVITPVSPAPNILSLSNADVEPVAGPGSTEFRASFESRILALTQANHMTIARLDASADYGVSFTASDGVAGAVNVPVTISIIVESSDHEILPASDGAFRGEKRTIIENNGPLALTVNVRDTDLARNLVRSENITFAEVTAIETTTSNDISDKITWNSEFIEGNNIDDTISNTLNIIELNDEDVGTYEVTWEISDRLKATDRVSTRTFTLEVQNVLEPIALAGGTVTLNYEGKALDETNRTLATIDDITISGDDVNLLASGLGYGILLTITPENIDRPGVITYTNEDGNAVSVIRLDSVGNVLLGNELGVYDDEFALKYFISADDIAAGDTIPRFKLNADNDIAGDEFNITINAVLATSSGEGDAASTAAVAVISAETATITIETEYDIQSPPSVPAITTTGDFTGTGSNLAITEGSSGAIVVTFTDKNIENGTLETFGGIPIEAFSANFKILGSDPLPYDMNFATPADFVITAGTDMATLTIPFDATNELAVGVRGYKLTLMDSRTEDTVRAVTGNINIQRADSAVDLGIRLDTILGTPETLDNTMVGDDIRIVVNVTTEDFVEGGNEHAVTDITIENVIFSMSISGGSTFDCSAGSRVVSSSGSESPTTFNDKNEDIRQALLLKIPLDGIDATGNSDCARLDADIVNVRADGEVNVTLSNGLGSRTVSTLTTTNNRDHVYERTGMRSIVPTVASNPMAIVAVGGGVATLEFSVTDVDDDDGPDNVIRNGRYTRVLSSVSSAGGSCDSSKWTLSTPTFKDGANDVYIVNVTANTGSNGAPVGEHCDVTLVVSEDGDESIPSIVRVAVVDVAVPTIDAPTDSDVSNATARAIGISNKRLGTFNIGRPTASIDITNLGLVLSVTATKATDKCLGITIANGNQPAAGSPGSYSFTYSIASNAVSGDDCVITIKATETATGGATFSNTTTVSIIPRREEKPTLSALSGNADSVTNYGTGSVPGTKTFRVSATVTDVDDGNRGTVTSTLTTGSSSICTVPSPTMTGPGLKNWDVVIGAAGRPGNSNACVVILNSEADSADADERRKTINLPQIAPTFTFNNYPTTGVKNNPVSVSISVTDTDNDVKYGTAEIIELTTGCNPGAVSGGNTASQTFTITSPTAQGCNFKVKIDEDGEITTSDEQTITFVNPVTLAWSDQLNDDPFNGYMSIGDTRGTAGRQIPWRELKSFVPNSIGARLAMVNTRFPIPHNDAIALNYIETKFAISDFKREAHSDILNFARHLEDTTYIGPNNRDYITFYANTNYENFNSKALTGVAKTQLTTAGIERYLRFTSRILRGLGNKQLGSVRSPTTISFVGTYTGESRIIRNAANDANATGDVPVIGNTDITDLINIDVSNIPAGQSVNISASMCRLDGFNSTATEISETNLNCGAEATPAQLQRILLLDGYWKKEGFENAACTIYKDTPPIGFNSYGWVKNTTDAHARDYYCTGNNAVPVPQTGVSTYKVLSNDNSFPMHIRQFMNTHPHTTNVRPNDYSLNEYNGYYLITITAKTNGAGGTKITGSNELKMLFHVGTLRSFPR